MFVKKYLALVKQKFIPLCILSIAAGAMFYVYVEKKAQQFVASAIIEYDTEDATAPDGTEIDTDEIISSEVISKACADIGENISADSIRSGISITPIVDAEEEALYESKLEHGEEYEIKNNRYKITYSAETGSSKNLPRKVLNAVLEEYFDYYGKYHSSVNGVVNDIDDLNVRGNYDYIEIMDIINNSLDAALDILSNRISSNNSFRSSSSGYTFQDLYSELSYLRNTESPIISAQILQQKATKDKSVLVAAYKKKNADLDIDSNTSKERAEDLEEIMDTYASMMKEAGSANLDTDHIIQDVSDEHGVDVWNSKADKTTEYDTLMTDWVKITSGYKKNEVEYAYNQYIIDTFADADETNTVEAIETEIDTLLEEANMWFGQMNLTMNDYNAVLGAQNVSMLTNVTISEKIPGKTYSIMIVMAVFAALMIALALLLRVHEILGKETEDPKKPTVNATQKLNAKNKQADTK